MKIIEHITTGGLDQTFLEKSSISSSVNKPISLKITPAEFDKEVKA